jgi:hypothetical protein
MQLLGHQDTALMPGKKAEKKPVCIDRMQI